MKYVKMGIVHDAWPWPLSDESIEEVIEMISELSDAELFRMIAGLNPRGMTEGWLVKESGGGKPMLVSNFTFKQDYKLLSEVLHDEQNVNRICYLDEAFLRKDEGLAPHSEIERAEKDRAFTSELADVINKHSLENRFDIPDFLLARMIMGHLNALESVVKETRDWWGACK